MTRSEILATAHSYVCKDRNAQYGEPEDSFEVIAELWEVYLTHRHATETTINPEDVGVMMALMKIARISLGKAKTDSYIDACGYIACAGEIATRREVGTETDDKLHKNEAIKAWNTRAPEGKGAQS